MELKSYRSLQQEGSEKSYWRYFPDGPVVKTLYFHCRGVGSISGQGTKILYAKWQGQINK